MCLFQAFRTHVVQAVRGDIGFKTLLLLDTIAESTLEMNVAIYRTNAVLSSTI